MKTIFFILKLICAIEFIIILFLFFKGYSKYLKAWVDERKIINASYDRIRFLAHLILVPFSFYILYLSINSYDFNKNLFYKISFLIFPVALGFIVFLIRFSWSKKFEEHCINKKKESIEEKPCLETEVKKKPIDNFNLKITSEQLKKLYDDLIRYEIIVKDKTGLNDLSNVLTKNWNENEHESYIYFNEIDNPSMREFFEFLKIKFGNDSFKLTHFIRDSKRIKKENTERYDYNGVKNSKKRTPKSKKNEIFIKIFNSI